MSISSGSPGFLHEDTVSVFFLTLMASLREVAVIYHPPAASLIVHEGQRKLRYGEPETLKVPDSIVTIRHMGRNYDLYWTEVCMSQTSNDVFKKVRLLPSSQSYLTLSKLANMLRGGLRPILGIVVVIAHEKRSHSPIPLVLKSEWKTREPMNPTHQEQEVLYGVAQPDEEVYAVDPAPGVYNDEVEYIWGSETCPPLAFDGVKAHGSICITAYNIPPSQYARVMEPCNDDRGRDAWAQERFAFTVSCLPLLNMFSLYIMGRLSRSPTCSSDVTHGRCVRTGCACRTNWSCSSTSVVTSSIRPPLPFPGLSAL